MNPLRALLAFMPGHARGWGGAAPGIRRNGGRAWARFPSARPTAAALALLFAPAAMAAEYTAEPLHPRTPAADGAKPFEVLEPAACGVTVPNVFDDPRMWGSRFRELTLGAVETGVAVADFDHDGRPDIFAISKNGPCALYRQVDAFRFVDVAKTAGVACDDPGSSKTGVSVIDINQDGWPDLYVCRYDAPNRLYVNNHDGTFTERAREYGLDIKDASVHAVFADYDRDGALDCYLVTNLLDFSKGPQGRRDYLLHNDGHGHFTDVTARSGIWGLTQGHTAIWIDINHDGWPDLYVADDFETPDRLYLNQGDGTFADVVDAWLPHVTYFSMGADAGDINNDGRLDFLITDMRDRTHAEFMAGMEEIGRGLGEMERVAELIPQYMWNAVYLNTGTDRFAEVAHLTGLDATGWTWSARLGDLDNDGRLDAFITSGMIRNFIDPDLVDKQNVAPTLAARAQVWRNSAPRAETTLAYRNLGDLRFANVSGEWGLDHRGVSFGCVLADLDGDGALDLVFSNYDAPPTVIRNHTTTGHRVAIKLAGRAPNLDGIGAELRIETAAGVQVRELFTERGIASSEPPVVHFGLGDDAVIRTLTIRWPRGQRQVLHDLPADQLLTIAEPPLADGAGPAPAVRHGVVSAEAWFSETAAARGLKHATALRPVDELSRQPLLPRRLNNECAALAVADVNGDGIDDIFVGGSGAVPGELFLGTATGTYRPAPGQPWSELAGVDLTHALFFDVNGDGHPDLLLVAGGVAHPDGDSSLLDHLYLNDGHGAFAPAAPEVYPSGTHSKSTAVAADFDGDGHLDLFVGGRVMPGQYPAAAPSALYRNVNGRLVDVTDTLAPMLRGIGMVTSAAWADIDGDRRPDLLLTVEWGAVVFLHNTGRGFEDLTARAGLAGATGWWRAITIADVNGDGRPDLVVGNVGLNTKYHASTAEPTLLFAGDLDGSGRSHLIEAQFEGAKLYPLRGRSKLASVFPWLTKRFPTYQAFAAATLDHVFGAEQLATARRFAATELRSGIFVQQPDGTFAFSPLPRLAQIAPINAIVAADFDGDGHRDLLCAGNDFGPEPNTGRFDGGIGVLLKSDGHGGFKPLPAGQSGISIPGETRALAGVTIPGVAGVSTVVVRSTGRVLLFTPQTRP